MTETRRPGLTRLPMTQSTQMAADCQPEPLLQAGQQMSDTAQDSDWWLASDSKWYPPQSRTPALTAPEAPSPPNSDERLSDWGMAIPSLVLGILSIIVLFLGWISLVFPAVFTPVLGILAYVFGNLGRGRSEGRSRTMATWGVVLGTTSVSLLLLVILVAALAAGVVTAS